MAPTIYLTNAATVTVMRRRRRDRADTDGSDRELDAVIARSVGGGRVYTIMAKPNPAYGQAGEGRVLALVPKIDDLESVQLGYIRIDEYRRRCEVEFARFPLGPGLLMVHCLGGGVLRPVEPDSTLICACSRTKAAAGECHRVWAAAALSRAGWRAVLDGAEVAPSVGESVRNGAGGGE